METAKPACADPVIWNQWHVISALDEIGVGVVNETLLLDERISFTATGDGECRVWRSSPDLPAGAEIDGSALPTGTKLLPVKPEYGYLWTSLGEPPDDLFPLPEYHHPKRRNMNAGSVGVATSAPRAVENFLDLAHFPYVLAQKICAFCGEPVFLAKSHALLKETLYRPLSQNTAP